MTMAPGPPLGILSPLGAVGEKRAEGAMTSVDAATMTKTSAFLGSPLYMSPEQMESSKGVDARTDVWSLGIIVFELLTGRPAFDADTMTEVPDCNPRYYYDANGGKHYKPECFGK
jgi:serine/threonine protein kinase